MKMMAPFLPFKSQKRADVLMKVELIILYFYIVHITACYI